MMLSNTLQGRLNVAKEVFKIVSMICLLVWNIFVLGGTFYAVQFYDWSPWWFLLTVCMIVIPNIKLNDKEEEDDSHECGC